MTPKERKKLYCEVSLYSLCVGLIIVLSTYPASFLSGGSKEAYLFLYCAFYAFALIGPALTALFFSRKKMTPLKRKKLKYPPAAAVIFLAFLLISAYINFLAIYPLGTSGIFVNVFNLTEVSSLAELIALALQAAIIAPIAEELFFRGYILRRLAPIGQRQAIFLSAVFFSAFHMNVAQFIYTFIAGLMFGYLAALTGKLRYSIIFHAINNSISVAVSAVGYFIGAEASATVSARIDVLTLSAALCAIIFILLERKNDPDLYKLKKSEGKPKEGRAISAMAVFYALFVLCVTALTNLAVFYR